MLREICHSLSSSSSSSSSCRSIHFSLIIYHSVAMPLYTPLAKWCENDKKRFNFDGCESIRPTQRIVKMLLKKKTFLRVLWVSCRRPQNQKFLRRYHRWFFIGKHDKWIFFSWRVSIREKIEFCWWDGMIKWIVDQILRIQFQVLRLFASSKS